MNSLSLFLWLGIKKQETTLRTRKGACQKLQSQRRGLTTRSTLPRPREGSTAQS